MTASISVLPVWKEGANAAEWIQEVAAMAMANPERFSRIVIIAEENNKEGLPYKPRMWTRGIPHNTDIIGTLQTAIFERWEYMKGR